MEWENAIIKKYFVVSFKIHQRTYACTCSDIQIFPQFGFRKRTHYVRHTVSGVSFSSDLNIIMMLIGLILRCISFAMKNTTCITGVDLLTVGLRIFQLNEQVDIWNI